MGLNAVMAALRKEVNNAINAANIQQKGQVILGWPTAPQIVDILGKSSAQWQVSIYPQPARNATRWIDDALGQTAPVVYLAAGVNGAVLTLAGTGIPAIDTATEVNIHALIAGVNADIFAIGNPGDALAVTATDVAAAVTALALPGVTATPVANTVVLTGAVWQSVNVGGTGSIATEAQRISRTVQVTVWATGATAGADPDETLRFKLLDAIVGSVGTRSRHFITDSTGIVAYVAYRGDASNDDSQSAYSLYVTHIFYDIEYSVARISRATQIGVAEPTTTVVAGAHSITTTDFIGGP